MTAHEIDNMVSRFPKILNEAHILEIYEKAITINTKKATKYGSGVFQGKVLFLNIVLRPNFTRETIVNFHVCLRISKYGIKIQIL